MTHGQTVNVGPWFQGPTGSGQGGWTAHRLAKAIDAPVTVAIKRPIPLEVDLAIAAAERRVASGRPARTRPAGPGRYAVDTGLRRRRTRCRLADAADARTRFPLHDDHPVPVCFSCGANADSMQVHSGPLPDGRWATDWTVPEWAVDADGTVDEGALWAAIDCAQGMVRRATPAGGVTRSPCSWRSRSSRPLRRRGTLLARGLERDVSRTMGWQKTRRRGRGVRQRRQLRRPIQQFLDRHLASDCQRVNNEPFTRLARLP